MAAAIFAAESASETNLRILLLDGAKKPGAKILVSGGGRCNVTNEAVSPGDYAGGPQPIIRNVLRAFDEQKTLEWMESLGVPLKLEPTGKYFPTSDSARTVLDALVRRVRELGVEFVTAARCVEISRANGGFAIALESGDVVTAPTVIVATGGLSLPKSGSDGGGLVMLSTLGHTIVSLTPSLSPLTFGSSDPLAKQLTALSGLTIEARLQLQEKSGRVLTSFTDSMLFTHFGLSGPAALNISRHFLRERLDHPASCAVIALGHPTLRNREEADLWLQEQARTNPKRLAANVLRELFPERLADVLAGEIAKPLATLSRADRLTLATRISALPLPVTGDRGYAFAETTAGGVDLREVDHSTMQSRKIPGLFLCGELLDVDGRIGGFNFQWAWATGYLAGRAAARERMKEQG
ncbi:NAD(P)/FAD-dependent oxidoreductase [soil metagenome]